MDDTLASQQSFAMLSPTSPAVLSALSVSLVSVLYSILTFTLNDRVSGKSRRVVLPAHVTQMLWYLCMLASRIAVIAIFAYLFQFYALVAIGGHILLTLIFLFIQRTTFCADLERLPNGELTFTRRWLLEIPFDVVAAVMYVFVYFNLKRGRTKIWASLYHFVVLLENSAMATLIYFYHQLSSSTSLTTLPNFQLISLVAIIGLYVLGIVFMLAFYLLCHPGKTDCCFWVGIPRKCCPCFKSDYEVKDEDEEVEPDGGRETRDTERSETRSSSYRGPLPRVNREGTDLRSQVGNGRVVISQPTLISHNGFVPRNLLPVGSREAEMAAANSSTGLGLSGENSIMQGTPGYQALANPKGRVSREDRVSEMDARTSITVSGSAIGQVEGAIERQGSYHTRRSGTKALPDQGRNGSTSTAHASNLTSPVFVSPTSSGSRTLSSSNPGRTFSESNNVFSDCPTSEMGSNTNDSADTVIDSPLFETTVIMKENSGVVRDRESKDVDSQKSCTDDTGIDMDSDNQLTQGTLGEMDEDIERNDTNESGYTHEDDARLPVFTDIPALQSEHRKQAMGKDFWRSNATTAAKEGSDSPEPLPPPPEFQDQINEHSRNSETPTLPTPTYSSSPADLTPSLQRRQIDLRDSTPGATSSGSQPSPERHRRVAPRSPIGARAFKVNGTDEFSPNSRGGSPSSQIMARIPRGGVAQSNANPLPHSSENGTRTPRSPKGARRLLVQQQGSSSPTPQTHTVTEAKKQLSSPSVPPPPVPPKDTANSTSTAQTRQNGLTRGLTSLVARPVDRAQSSSPMPISRQRNSIHSMSTTGTAAAIMAGSTTDPNIADQDPRVSRKIPKGGVSNYSRGMSASTHHLSASQRHQPHQRRSPRADSWHENKANSSFSMHNIREKRMSAYSGSMDIHSKPATTSTFTGHHQAEKIGAHPTPPRNTPRSISSPGSGPPRLTKQGMVANYMQQRSPYIYPAFSTNSPQYPRHPQGALGNNTSNRSKSPPRKRLVSAPNHRLSLSTTSDGIDEPLNLKSSSGAWNSSTGNSSSRGSEASASKTTPAGPNPIQAPSNLEGDEIYDKLEPEVQAQLRAKPVPPIRYPNHYGRPHSRPLSFHVPTISTHESAV